MCTSSDGFKTTKIVVKNNRYFIDLVCCWVHFTFHNFYFIFYQTHIIFFSDNDSDSDCSYSTHLTFDDDLKSVQGRIHVVLPGTKQIYHKLELDKVYSWALE